MIKDDIRAQYADEAEMREQANFLAAEGSRFGLTAYEQIELNALCAWLGDGETIDPHGASLATAHEVEDEREATT